MGGRSGGRFLTAGAFLLALQVGLPAMAASVITAQPETGTETESDEKTEYSVVRSNNAIALLDRWDDLLILDVRTSAAFERGHIKDAINIDMKDTDFSSKIGKLDNNRPILVYSYIDPPTNETADIFGDAGFSEIVYLLDGFRGWKLNNLPVEKGGMPLAFDSSARPVE